jgi:hypothetical protein
MTTDIDIIGPGKLFHAAQEREIGSRSRVLTEPQELLHHAFAGVGVVDNRPRVMVSRSQTSSHGNGIIAVAKAFRKVRITGAWICHFLALPASDTMEVDLSFRGKECLKPKLLNPMHDT